MRRLQYSFFSVILFTLISAQSAYGQLLDSKSPNSPWFSQAINHIQQEEYSVLESEEYGYQSPNRQHYFRAFYKPSGLSISNRVQSDNNWTLSLSLSSVVMGDEPLTFASNETELKANSIEFRNEAYTQQYTNSQDGLKQNVIIHHVPQGSTELILTYEVDGLEAEQWSADSILLFQNNERNKSRLLWYTDLVVWDANGNEQKSQMQLVENKIELRIQLDNAKAPLLVDPLLSSYHVLLDSNQNSAALGASVYGAGDVNGDGYSDVAIGAPYYDNGQTDEGVVFVYHGSASGLSNTADLLLEVNNANDLFGSSVALAGDVNADGYGDLVVGVPLFDNGQTDEGRAYIYYGSSTGLSNSTFDVMEQNQANASFGTSVASAGDINGDGYSDVLVGAPLFDNGNTDEGVVFVFEGSATGLDTTYASLLEQNQDSSNFGISVSSAGDVDADGYSDVVVGASLYDNGETDEGNAFIYLGASGGLNTALATRLEANQGVAHFGSAVSFAGDINGDGYSDVLVGAENWDNGSIDEGGVFIYNGSSSGLSSTLVLRLEVHQSNANLGTSVACAGDVNGDGYSDIMVGAPNFDNGDLDEGIVLIYQGSLLGIDTLFKMSLEIHQDSAHFGYKVAPAGDVNGDGYSDVIIGSPEYDNGNSDEGAAFVYLGSPDSLNTIYSLLMQEDQDSSNYSIDLSSAGDLNGDGYMDIAIGAFLYDNGQTDEGAVFVYYGSVNGPSVSYDVMLERNQGDAYFGRSIASAGDLNSDGYSELAVGALKYNNGQTDEGMVFIYDGSSTGISTTPSLSLEANQAASWFGHDVAGVGDVNSDGFDDFVVVAMQYDSGVNQEGALFGYLGSSSGISSTADWFYSGKQSSGLLAFVSPAGDVNGDGFADFIVGAPYYNNGSSDEGVAMVFQGDTFGFDTGYSTLLEENVASAYFGYDVSLAGDVDGDGYGDVIVGAYRYNNGLADEGAAFVYYGGTTGITTAGREKLVKAQGAAFLGCSVSGGGDINSDGYSDVIVGAYNYDNGNTNEGVAFVYLGSSTGLNTNSVYSYEAEQDNAYMGTRVAMLGDVNGDGFGDFGIGAPGYDNGESDEGIAFIYYGAQDDNRHNNPRLYDEDTTNLFTYNSVQDPGVGVGLFSSSFIGRQHAYLVVETTYEGNPFSSGTTLANSVSYTVMDTIGADLGRLGKELKLVAGKSSLGMRTKVRARIKYEGANMLTGQVYSPWRYVPDVPYLTVGVLPVEIVYFNVEQQSSETALLQWSTASEFNVSHFAIERSVGDGAFEQMAIVQASGNSTSLNDYTFTDNIAGLFGNICYRIRAYDYDAQEQLTEVKCLNISTGLILYPNPSHGILHLQSGADVVRDYSIEVFNSLGDQCNVSQTGTHSWDMSELVPGVYLIHILGDEISRGYFKVSVIR
ncbi:MAG: FG-GAP repeat protein [Bacteroidia bacterium]